MKKKNKIGKICRWVILNGALFYCAWAGVNGSEGAARTLVFFTWLFAVLNFIGATNDELSEQVRSQGRSIPAWLSHGLGFVMISFLVWHGWWMTAIAALIIEMTEAAIYHEKHKTLSQSSD
jgi:4-amino-4-deoxy-L-arabinose transferase-like glycosyltransferase